jgi:hypothetical protein
MCSTKYNIIINNFSNPFEYSKALSKIINFPPSLLFIFYGQGRKGGVFLTIIILDNPLDGIMENTKKSS